MKISQLKRDKISEQILFFLYENSPKPIFTSHIAREIARDEEFVKKLLFELKQKNLVKEIKKNSQGRKYVRRSRWVLNKQVYHFFNNKNNS